MDDVLIVGAGPVGLVTALGLAQAGVAVTVLEAAPEIARSPRAITYHWSVLDGIERLGILDDAKRIGFTKQDYSYLVFASGEKISWSLAPLADHTRHPYNLHLGQDRLADIALEHLQRCPNARIYWRSRCTDIAQDANGVVVSVESPELPKKIRAGWVIGADGGRSTIREAMGQKFDGNTWPERFVATNIRFDFGSRGYSRATMVIDPQHGAILAKIDNSDLWRYTYCESTALVEEDIPARIPARLDAIIPGAKDYELVEYAPYRMHQRAADRFRIGRVLLIGDAAHITNPIGGLGLTSGLFDSYALCGALASVIWGETGDYILDRYAEERRRIFLTIASPQAAENKRLIFNSDDPVRLEEDLKRIRRMATDPDFMIERSLFTKRLETKLSDVS